MVACDGCFIARRLSCYMAIILPTNAPMAIIGGVQEPGITDLGITESGITESGITGGNRKRV